MQGKCVMLEEGGEGEEAGWVEAELERELAGLAHLTLQDLEEDPDGFHGNKEVWWLTILILCSDGLFCSSPPPSLRVQEMLQPLM